MIQRKDVMKSLPLLAGILGRQYNVRVEIGGAGAFTDGNTIHLPALLEDMGDTLLKVTKGFLDHEAAHIRETNFAKLKAARLTPFQLHLMNIVEDWRVEERLSAIYPGCGENFRFIIRYLFESVPENSHTPPVASIPEYLLLAVRTWAVPEIQMHKDKVAAEVDAHFEGLREQLDACLENIRPQCRTTSDSIRFALELEAIIRQWVESPKKRDSPEDHAELSENTEKGRESIKELLKAAKDELPEGIGEMLGGMLVSGFGSQPSTALTVATAGTMDTKPLPQDILMENQRLMAGLSARLRGALQASVLVRSRPAERGKLSASRLYRSMTGSGHICLKQERTQGMSTHVHVLLDNSGSMAGSRSRLAVSCCHALASACVPIRGLSVAVTAFNDAGSKCLVFPLLKPEQRLHANMQIRPEGGTSLAPALWWAMQQMLFVRENRKILFIITDGRVCDVMASKNALALARRIGLEIYGIGILDEHIRELLPESGRNIYNLRDFPAAFFDMMRGSLMRGASI